MVPLGDEAQVEAHFGPFKDSANLDVGHVESHFFPFRDSVRVTAR
jgi:hypothetical protein